MVVAVCGLAAFALVLALVEQVVLELIDANVKRGSEVRTLLAMHSTVYLLGS